MPAKNARCYACSQLSGEQMCDYCIRRQAEDAERDVEAAMLDRDKLMSPSEVIGYLTAVQWLNRPGIKSATYTRDDGTEVVLSTGKQLY